MRKIDNEDMRQSEPNEDPGQGEPFTSRERHLWIVDQYAVPPTMSGFTRQFEHSALLKDMDWQSRLVASPFNHKTHVMDRPVSWKNRRLDQVESGVPVSWVYSIPYHGNNWRRYLNMISFLVTSQISSRGVAKPDVVLASSPHLFTGMAGWITAKRFRTPFIFEVRDLWPESLVQLGLTTPAIIRPLAWMEKFLYRRADHIVALTDGIKEGILRKGVAPSKVTVIPNGSTVVELDTRANVDDLRSKRGWDSKFVVGWIGAHGSANHLETIVDAARILQMSGDSDIHFVLIGDGPEKDKLKQSSVDLRNIEFLDPMPKEEVYRILQLMNAGVIVHSDTEAVRGARPNKLFDYMAVGLPIISNLQGETENLIAQAKCGVTVPTMDAEKLAEASLMLSGNRKLAEELGSNGRPYLAATHDRRSLTANFASVLNNVCGR